MQVAILLASTIPTVRATLTDFDILLLALAALGHDAGHAGFNSAFEVARRSPIALNHGMDGPVLERFHAAKTIGLLEECGVLVLLTSSQRAAALHTITSAIMATDMSRHVAIVGDLERCGTLDTLAHDALGGAIVHSADLSAHSSSRSISLTWTKRIAEEFSNQVTAEELHGLPISPFMAGLDTPSARAKMQATFVSRVVAPLWRALAALADGKLDVPLLNIDGNAVYYASECERLAASDKRGRLSLRFVSRKSADISIPTSPQAAASVSPTTTTESFQVKTDRRFSTTITPRTLYVQHTPLPAMPSTLVKIVTMP